MRGHRLATRWSLACALLLAAAPALGAGAIDEIVTPGAQAEVLGTGYGFAEGPAADADGNVYFSDGKNDAIHVYRPGKAVAVFVDDSSVPVGADAEQRKW